TRIIKEEETTEISYYISSLEVDLAQISRVIRGHWAIENSSHWVLDMTFKEDESRIRRGDAPENMATFRRFSMNLARLSPIKDSIKGKLKQAGWSDEVREKIIFG
ncbi:ISAs1 family transposase, partial [Psychromonas arctica]